MRSLRALVAVALTGLPLGGSPEVGATARPHMESDEAIDIVVIGRRPHKGPLQAKVPPHCVKRPNDPADLVPVRNQRTNQRVIAPDRHGNLTWQSDREPILGPAVWQRAGNGIGQYIFRVPDDGLPMCIGAIEGAPSGWGQLRQIIKTPSGTTGKYMHFSALVAARDADEIRFWLAADITGDMVKGGDTHTASIKGTFGWKIADVIVGPLPSGSNHISYGFLLWGRGDIWVWKPTLTFETREQVKNMPSLPVSSKIDYTSAN